VVYGVVGLKTHAKLCLVVRQEADGLRRYCHIGTGNYNPKTARLYEDLGLLTCNPQVGEDLTRLFNQLSGWAPRSRFKRLLVAPRSVRWGLIDQIDAEIENVREGLGGYVGFKLNSIVDDALIDALYRASQAGVKVDLWIRGICAVRPGVEGLSENIRVRSIVGRFLEHSRIYRFGSEQRGPRLFIGSADLMPRNLDHRVECVTEVIDRDLRDRLDEILRVNMEDDALAWKLDPDGWSRVPTVVGLETHTYLQRLAEESAK
jgi:polyphosphate kinase